MNESNNQKQTNKIALIVEGGGFKSGFTAGILDSFLINDYNPFHIYIGVSGGAMNLTSYIARQYKRNFNIIKTMSKSTNFISIVRFLKGGNYVELKYLMDLTINEFPLDINTANKRLINKECKVVVTNYLNGNPAYLSVKKFGWKRTMEATGSIPIATRGYCEIAGKKYIDGGLADPLPVKRVYDWGYRDIILLRTHAKHTKPNWKLESLYAPFFYDDNLKLQKLILKNDKIYSHKQKFISNPPQDLNIYQISPEEDLECGVILSNSEQVKKDYRYGVEKGMDALNEIS